VLVPAVIFGLGGLVTHWWSRNRGLIELDVKAGRTAPAGIVMIVAMLSGALVVLFAYVLFFTEAGEEADQVGPLQWLVWGFSVSAAFMSAMSLHRWRWNHEGLEFRGALRSVRLRWTDLERAGRSWHGGWFARDREGRRIFWSDEYTTGGDVITAAVALCRPDLIAPN